MLWLHLEGFGYSGYDGTLVKDNLPRVCVFPPECRSASSAIRLLQNVVELVEAFSKLADREFGAILQVPVFCKIPNDGKAVRER
ncbi:hypothetical protein [Rhizobium ruizarguesonis]|uniref:hypothetical protein n=1 Tax=Rhizobium ruizarguesonis TaxID=2081791 RepID=UPI00143F203E|nr:hypothetical protein [Rhizobium ruizarguesonis]